MLYWISKATGAWGGGGEPGPQVSGGSCGGGASGGDGGLCGGGVGGCDGGLGGNEGGGRKGGDEGGGGESGGGSGGGGGEGHVMFVHTYCWSYPQPNEAQLPLPGASAPQST